MIANANLPKSGLEVDQWYGKRYLLHFLQFEFQCLKTVWSNNSCTIAAGNMKDTAYGV